MVRFFSEWLDPPPSVAPPQSVKELLTGRQGRGHPTLLLAGPGAHSYPCIHSAQNVEIMFTSCLFQGSSLQGQKIGFSHHLCYLLETHSIE